MSSVEDLLFAPIHQKAKKAQVDFLIRVNSIRSHNRDWKPISKRARNWMKTFFAPALIRVGDDGWISSFSTDPIPDLIKWGVQKGLTWAEELHQRGYTFGEEEP